MSSLSKKSKVKMRIIIRTGRPGGTFGVRLRRTSSAVGRLLININQTSEPTALLVTIRLIKTFCVAGRSRMMTERTGRPTGGDAPVFSIYPARDRFRSNDDKVGRSIITISGCSAAPDRPAVYIMDAPPRVGEKR